MITAIHINSTTPFFLKNKEATYSIEDFELLTTILSALMWRKNNGPIKLYTDSVGYDYYASLDLLDLWDGGVDHTVVEHIPKSVNQEIFWAAAKIFAIQNEATPIAMIDTDLIVWHKIISKLEGKPLVVLHREPVHECYLPAHRLKKRSDYQFDPQWDWTELPCNTAFAYFSTPELKNYYTSCAIDFMTNNSEYPLEMVSQMVFAEQRILSLCAKKMNIPIHHLLDDPFQSDNKLISHIWGAKSTARNYPGQRNLLCSALLEKIEQFFPEYYGRVKGIGKVEFTPPPYFQF
ncbi:MAG: hypothetical protein FWC10_03935 [Lentimicrobiaceae bacterium]|nr:hypothetical protein [Lentimicrobiaceae bacterium]